MQMDDLPLELWQTIVEISASSSSSQAASLSEVSGLFHSWVRPIQFRIFQGYKLRVTSPGFLEAAWFEKNGKYIQDLIWELEARQLLPLLSSCPNLQNFALWYSGDDDLSSFLPILTTIQPRRLSLNLPALFSDSLFTRMHAQDAAFRNLTHLDLISNIDEWAEIEGIGELPSLTHLAYSGEFPLEIVHAVLKYCKTLQVLVLLPTLLPQPDWPVFEPETVKGIEFDANSDDPRIVVFVCRFREDWEKGAQGGKDMWLMAEEIVAKRGKEKGSL
ncbi:hypothetical protein BDN72DRAFT_846247 [Pluteus cervinus]|uniref:Uncharacterized protein n=1 Tax=Pluteus cervinus TaxID=181527 RepID=A0ACD3AIZ9_9AGAR|nr:hypothetical protein BDN72DRAFT_846247 [Pluteus cervinus]